MRVDTDIQKVFIEIEDNEYEVAENTIYVAEKLLKAEKDAVGNPLYKYWLAVTEILLGKEACKKLFTKGKNENLDRIERIAKYTLRAFSENTIELEKELQQDKVNDITERIQPMTDFLREANKMNVGASTEEKNVKVIRRG